MPHCEKCNSWHTPKKCPPVWKVTLTDHIDDKYDVRYETRAYSAEDAAENYAKEHLWENSDLDTSHDVTVFDAKENRFDFEIEPEEVIVYNVTEKEA